VTNSDLDITFSFLSSQFILLSSRERHFEPIEGPVARSESDIRGINILIDYLVVLFQKLKARQICC
jgi:hypothetical protein